MLPMKPWSWLLGSVIAWLAMLDLVLVWHVEPVGEGRLPRNDRTLDSQRMIWPGDSEEAPLPQAWLLCGQGSC
jgi:hypothetical protein